MTLPFYVNNNGLGSMSWTASVTSGSSWLSITSGSSGTNMGTITVSTSQYSGTGGASRTGTIRVTATGAVDSPKDITIVQGPITGTSIQDVLITAAAGSSSGDSSATVLTLREYWQQNTIYDDRGFMKVYLSTIPRNATVTGATFGIWYIDAYGGTNINNLDMGRTADDLYPLTLNYTTCDGTNNWISGSAAGVDGYNRIHPYYLGSVQVNPNTSNRYVTISSSALQSYLSTQISNGQNAFFEFSIDDANGGYQRFYSADYTEATKRPYLEITYTTP